MKDAENLQAIALRMRKAAEELRNFKPQVKTASEELDPQHVINFLRFYGVPHAEK